MYYPGITLPIDLNKKDKNFFFRHPIDFQGLKLKKETDCSIVWTKYDTGKLLFR